MSKHPLNLAIRFGLEIGAILSFGIWGFRQADDWLRYLLAILLPLLFALLWGVFAVSGDPSRSGKTVVPTPGPIRLILELVLFGGAAWMLIHLGYAKLGWIFAGLVFLHYASSYDRIAWLWKQK